MECNSPTLLQIHPAQGIAALYQLAIQGDLYHDDRERLLQLLELKFARLLQFGKLVPVEVCIAESVATQRMRMHIQQAGKNLTFASDYDGNNFTHLLTEQEAKHYQVLEQLSRSQIKVQRDSNVLEKEKLAYQSRLQHYKTALIQYQTELQERDRQNQQYQKELRAWGMKQRRAAVRWANARGKDVTLTWSGLVQSDWLEAAQREGFCFQSRLSPPANPLHSPRLYAKPKVPKAPQSIVPVGAMNYQMGMCAEVDAAIAWATAVVEPLRNASLGKKKKSIRVRSLFPRLQTALRQQSASQIQVAVVDIFKQILCHALSDAHQIHEMLIQYPINYEKAIGLDLLAIESKYERTDELRKQLSLLACGQWSALLRSKSLSSQYVQCELPYIVCRRLQPDWNWSQLPNNKRDQPSKYVAPSKNDLIGFLQSIELDIKQFPRQLRQYV